jgi:hypothetical protein
MMAMLRRGSPRTGPDLFGIMIGIYAEAGPIGIYDTENVAAAWYLQTVRNCRPPAYFAAAQEFDPLKPDHETRETHQGVGKGPRPGDEVIAYEHTPLRLSAYSCWGEHQQIKPHACLANILQSDYADISPLRHL